MISQTTEYALRAAVRMAAAGDQALTVESLAKETRIPAGYLAKILQILARAGIVRSRRGLGGGFTLNKPPAKQSLLEIVNAVDPVRRIRSCPVDLASHAVRLCPLHRRLDEAMANLEKAYASTTLGQILDEPVTCRAIIGRTKAAAVKTASAGGAPARA